MAIKFITGNTLIAPASTSALQQADHTGSLVFDNKDYLFDGSYPSISDMQLASVNATRPRSFGYVNGG